MWRKVGSRREVPFSPEVSLRSRTFFLTIVDLPCYVSFSGTALDSFPSQVFIRY